MKPIPFPSCFRPTPPPPQTIPTNNPSLPLEINGLRPPEVEKIPLGYSSKRNLTPNPNRSPANIAASAPNQPRSKINPPSPRSVDSASLETKKRKPNAAASAERKNPNSYFAFWSSPPPKKAKLAFQFLKKSTPYFRFCSQNSLFIQINDDSKGLWRRRGLQIRFLRRIKVRNRSKRSKKSEENSNGFSPRRSMIRKADFKEARQRGKEALCSSLSVASSEVLQLEKRRKGSKQILSELGASSTADVDCGLFRAWWWFPALHGIHWRTKRVDEVRGFGVISNLLSLSLLCSARKKGKEELSRRGRRFRGRPSGCIGGWKGVLCDCLSALSFIFKRSKSDLVGFRGVLEFPISVCVRVMEM